MTNRIRIKLPAICVIAFLVVIATQSAFGQAAGLKAPVVKNPSPELIGQLTKELSITPEQAVGGSGALFGLAKTNLSPDDFTKVANVVPGMDSLLKAAPKPKQSATGAMGAMGGMLPGKIGGMASVASSFKGLGLSPEMAGKFVPVMTKFLQTKGGADVAGLLAGALK